MNDDDVVVELRNLTKEYLLGVHVGGHRTLASMIKQKIGRDQPTNKSFNALDDISFDLRSGETIGLVGANGSGKTTLLKIINRVTSPTSGSCRVRGRVGSLLQVGAGFYTDLTGNENIAVVGAILGMSKSDISRQYDNIVEFAELPVGLLDTPVKRYSSGQFLRLAFSVSSHLDTEILLVDEVVSVGDAEFQQKCLEKLRSLALEGRTVVFVSHHLNLVSDLCSRSIWIDKGKIRLDGPCNEVMKEYRGSSV